MADNPVLDTTDLDRHMGVPMEPGELKDDVSKSDIRRWVQAMHYPNPLHYDERWAAESHFGAHRRAAVVHRRHRHQPRLLAGAGRPDPQLAPHLRRRRVVVLRPAHPAGRPPRLPSHAVRLQGDARRSSPARPASSGATRSTSTSGASASRSSARRPSATRSAAGQGEEAVRRAERAGVVRRRAAPSSKSARAAFIEQIQQLRHDKRLFERRSVGDKPAPRRARPAQPGQLHHRVAGLPDDHLGRDGQGTHHGERARGARLHEGDGGPRG